MEDVFHVNHPWTCYCDLPHIHENDAPGSRLCYTCRNRIRDCVSIPSGCGLLASFMATACKDYVPWKVSTALQNQAITTTAHILSTRNFLDTGYSHYENRPDVINPSFRRDYRTTIWMVTIFERYLPRHEFSAIKAKLDASMLRVRKDDPMYCHLERVIYRHEKGTGTGEPEHFHFGIFMDSHSPGRSAEELYRHFFSVLPVHWVMFSCMRRIAHSDTERNYNEQWMADYILKRGIFASQDVYRENAWQMVVSLMDPWAPVVRDMWVDTDRVAISDRF